MFEKQHVVLVDTNVIIEAHRVNCWQALSQYFRLQTVETVVVETQTGIHNRDAADTIDIQLLRNSLDAVHTVSELDRLNFVTKYPRASLLDPGELDLCIFAGTLKPGDAWLLNSPDKAAVRHAYERQWLDRVVALEDMTDHLKQRLALRNNYTKAWLSALKTKLILG